MIFGFARKMEIAMRPYMPSFGFGQPGPSNFVHVAPPSVDFQSALSGPPPLYPHHVLRRLNEDAYTMRGLDGSIATSLNPVSSLMYFRFFHVFPPSVDRNRPRSLFGPNKCPGAAMNTILGFVGSTA